MKNPDAMARRRVINDHFNLLEACHLELISRIAIAALKGNLFELRGNGKSRILSEFIRCRAWIAIGLLHFAPNLVMNGWFPGRIGRRLVIDTLILWSEQNGIL